VHLKHGARTEKVWGQNKTIPITMKYTVEHTECFNMQQGEISKVTLLFPDGNTEL
jgi:hypothetical protein